VLGKETSVAKAIYLGQVNPDRATASATLHFPDWDELGTGSLTIKYRGEVFPLDEPQSNILTAHPGFQMSATLMRDGHLRIAIGRGNGSAPIHEMGSVLPPALVAKPIHVLRIEFREWRISHARWDNTVELLEASLIPPFSRN
jgi:hypothetical protein